MQETSNIYNVLSEKTKRFLAFGMNRSNLDSLYIYKYVKLLLKLLYKYKKTL